MSDPTGLFYLRLTPTTGGARARLLLAALLALTACPGEGEDEGGSDGSGTTTVGPPTSTGGSSGPVEDTGDTTSATNPGTTTPGDESDTGQETDDTTGPPESCGDGMVQPPEACDDANGVDADGCNNDCTVSGSVLFEHTQAGGMGTDRAFGVAVDGSGYAYVVGELLVADNDTWIRQYEPDGALGFTNVLNLGGNDGARGVSARANGVFVTGYQGADLFLRSFDDQGNQGIAVTYNGPANGGDVGHAVATDPMGNAIVAGHHTINYFNGMTNTPHNDVFVRKYAPDGSVQWTHTYAGPINTGQDQARGVATDSMGNVIAVGWDTVSGQGRNVWVRKLDASGNVLWTQGYAGVDAMNDWAYAVATAPDDSIVVVGLESQMVIPTLMWMRKYDVDGNELWTVTWPGDTSEGAQALGVAVDDAGDISVTGQVINAGIGDIFVRKYDPDGGLKWSTLVSSIGGSNSAGRGATIAPDQRVWAAGERDMGVDGLDVWVARLAQ